MYVCVSVPIDGENCQCKSNDHLEDNAEIEQQKQIQ